MTDRKDHWDGVYGARAENALTWFEDAPEISIDMMRHGGLRPGARVVDVGGGASRLVDALLDEGIANPTVLDLSAEALKVSKDRLGARASDVDWVVADVTQWQPTTRFDIWHDRAVFHFLTEPKDRVAYVQTLTNALKPGGVASIGTFALDGPETCSNLPVQRYSPETLAEALGPAFELVKSCAHIHLTPKGNTQSFSFCVFRRL